MGSNDGSSDEKPVHRVTLKSFMISQSEVTVAQYRRCVNASVCSAPKGSCNWDKSGREDHPINCVSWFQLNEFAQWVGGRLPSEAEWEYAARSRGKNVTYPWGNQEPTCSYAVIDDGGDGCGKDRTWPVCSKTSGNTEQGLCDMAGNVDEWTLDEYESSYSGAPTNGDARCNASDCSQKTSKSAPRVLRGGCWSYGGASYLRAANRGRNDPSYRNDIGGGRVLRSLPLAP